MFGYNELVYGHTIKMTIKTEITNMKGTCVTFSTATREKAGALWAGTGVASRPQQTQVTACALTRVLHFWGETVYRHLTLSISTKSHHVATKLMTIITYFISTIKVIFINRLSCKSHFTGITHRL